MKRAGFLMERICAADNLLSAYHEAGKGKRQRDYVVAYSRNLFDNIARLQKALLSGGLKVGRYHYFYIHDPKLRKICAADFEERIVHHAIINICHPYFEKNLIADTYASRIGKGVYAALEKARSAMRKYGYVAKLDVRKYFDSISHEVLKEKLRRMFKDARLLALFDRIVDSYSSGTGRGVPIGNLTSQYFANYYLSFLDHHVMEVMRAPAYIRYMDDMLVFGQTRKEVKAYVREIDRYARDELKLVLKEPVFTKVEAGVSFLGYAVYPHKILLNRRSKVRFRNKMRKYMRMYETGEWSDEAYLNHVTPLLAFTRKAYTKGLRGRLCVCDS
ncbi:MAG: RNA-directed DNA polymerase [Bacteroides sp.]|nr:RNA-directed DNA polymerase [Bacteroides sp.]